MSSVIKRARIRLAAESGFTLSEMLVVIAILGLILGAFSLIFSSTIRHSSEIQEQSLLQTEVRSATDRIAREVRQAYYGDGTTSPIKTSTATQLEFYSLDEGQPYHLRWIAYRINAGGLERATAVSTNTGGPPWTFPALGAWGRVVGSVKNTTAFTYFDGTSPIPVATNVAANVRTVTVTLTEQSVTAPTRQSTYTASAGVRASS